MEKHCTVCHASTKQGPLVRQGAPQGYDFDDTKIIAKEEGEILEWVLENKKMPPGLVKPTDEEKAKLKEWLECRYRAG